MEVQYQFGAVHGALSQAPQKNPPANDRSRLAFNLDEYFDALAAATKTEIGVLGKKMKADAALDATNAELSASVSSLIKANEKISRQVVNRRTSNTCTRKYSPAPCPKALCPHFKIKAMHAP